MRSLADSSLDLVVTSPPYPMIAMWDELFCRSSRAVRNALAAEDGERAFELMHRRLDAVWDECYRTLREGGIICINIGDATRTLGDQFGLYPNHARILQHLRKCGFTALPDILWRKPTNAPNKFMGSGVLPVGAYVTLEHEYILIARKGARRVFSSEREKKKRRERPILGGAQRLVLRCVDGLDRHGPGTKPRHSTQPQCRLSIRTGLSINQHVLAEKRYRPRSVPRDGDNPTGLHGISTPQRGV